MAEKEYTCEDIGLPVGSLDQETVNEIVKQVLPSIAENIRELHYFEDEEEVQKGANYELRTILCLDDQNSSYSKESVYPRVPKEALEILLGLLSEDIEIFLRIGEDINKFKKRRLRYKDIRSVAELTTPSEKIGIKEGSLEPDVAERIIEEVIPLISKAIKELDYIPEEEVEDEAYKRLRVMLSREKDLSSHYLKHVIYRVTPKETIERLHELLPENSEYRLQLLGDNWQYKKGGS